LFLDQQGTIGCKADSTQRFSHFKVPALGRNGTDSQHSAFIDVDEVIVEQPIAVTRQSFDD